MSRTSKTLTRLGVPTLAAATLIGGIPLFTGTALADHVTSIALSSTRDNAVPAGTCKVYTATVNASTTTTIIDVQLDPGTSGVDPAFCTVSGGAATTTNGTVGGADTREFTVDTTGGTGTFTFGVISANGATGAVTTTAFAEAPNSPGNGNGIPNTGEVQTSDVTTFTAGGAQAAKNLAVTDGQQDPAVVGETVSYVATVTDSTGEPLPGVMPEYDVTNGPDSTLVGPGTDCGVTDQTGTTTCKLVPGGGPGVDTTQFVVNQVNADSDPATADTPSPDKGEPTSVETTTIVAAQGSRSVVVTALSATATADSDFSDPASTNTVNDTRDGNRAFRAVVDATNSDTSTVGTRLSFAVTGGSGDETVTPTIGDTASNAATTDTNDSAFEFTVNDPTPVSGEVLTVTATVRGTSQSGSATYSFKNRPTDARNIVLTPTSATTTPGTLRTFTATVVDSAGKPVENVAVTFTETGAGAFRDGSSTAFGTTNASGQTTAEVLSLATETGTQTITATISTSGTQATQAAGKGTDPAGNPVPTTQSAGNVSSTATNVYANEASPSPSPSTSVSPSPTATATVPGIPQCATPLNISINREYIVPTIPVTVSITGAAPGALVDLQAYSRPNTDFGSVRTRAADNEGRISFDVLPGTNTRLYAQCVDKEGGAGQAGSVSAQKVINVRTALSLSVVRNGKRDYTFQGRILPRRAGQLITLYRVNNDGTRVITSQLKTDETGTYRFRRVFTGSGTFGFLARTSQTLTNASGESTSPAGQRSESYLQSGRGTARPTAIF